MNANSFPYPKNAEQFADYSYCFIDFPVFYAYVSPYVALHICCCFKCQIPQARHGKHLQRSITPAQKESKKRIGLLTAIIGATRSSD